MAGHLSIKFLENEPLDGLSLSETQEVIAEVKIVSIKMAKYLWFMSPFQTTKRNGKEHIGKLMKLPDEYANFTKEECGIEEELQAFSYEPKAHKNKMVGLFEVHCTKERGKERIVKIYYVA
ncbi:hypothetical protein [Aquamicrobium sp.]|uniref:hypothetical protein n=1 Tax=Aquamicrobium sp. TaxID=1872579 RepID=UPI00258490A5|nr:hypothetical protein [Aquamicrobium sp.]MCK9552331.1 hypothetical protein [Aquamicrobium sp.]